MGLWRSIRKNAALLTVSSLVMQSLSMLWQVWLAAHIGAAGIGLFQLVGSVGFLFITLAVSGIRFSVTRLLAEELGQSRGGSVRAVMRRCCVYALFFGLSAAAILFLLAEPIGFLWIGDARSVRALCAAAPSLPALALSSALSGYFTAVGRVWKTALAQFFAQLLRMGLSMLFLTGYGRGDPAGVCAALSMAGTAAEIALSFALAVLYLDDRKRFCPAGECGAALTPRMLRIALPLASSAYARSALNTFRQLLVPRGLRLSGLSAESALAGYGVINGMAMPVLLLPSCLPLSVAELLVPALTEMQVAGERERVRRSVREMLGKTFLLSLCAAAVFFVFARPLGMLLYGSAEAARFLRLLAPMVPFLYTDIVTDGCLKGLGQMMASMAFNIAEAALGLVLVWALLPRWALTGYLVTLYLCELFNFTLSLLRLRKVVKTPGFCPS